MKKSDLYIICSTLLLLGSTTSFAATVYEKLGQVPRIIENDRGEKVSFANLKGQALVVTMAYSECKKSCPLVTIAKLKELQTEISANHIPDPTFVVLSYDSEHDTPAIWSEYRKKKHLEYANWQFWTADTKTTHQIAETIGLGNYWQMDDHILHGYRILIFGQDGELFDALYTDHDQIKTAIAKLKSSTKKP